MEEGIYVETFDELVNALTPENCEMMFRNLLHVLAEFRIMKDKVGNENIKMKGFTFIDDGKVGLKRIDFFDRESGELIKSIENDLN